ncbi:hypothetical protein [Maritalea sp.]|uniref:hypothetical protein n=1 Tax=Maritalea sp. TaxID=2003361 RepID=UPI0039E24EC2
MDNNTETTPIACALTGEAQRSETKRFRTELVPHILERELLVNGAKFVFSNTDSAKQSVERLVSIDMGCCTFLNHEVETFDDTIVLTVTSEGEGIALAQQFLNELEHSNGRC